VAKCDTLAPRVISSAYLRSFGVAQLSAQRTNTGRHPGIAVTIGFLDAAKASDAARDGARDGARHQFTRHRPQPRDSAEQIGIGWFAPQGASRVFMGFEAPYGHSVVLDLELFFQRRCIRMVDGAQRVLLHPVQS